jgi:tetratricopeptide (TPR) repeat protein
MKTRPGEFHAAAEAAYSSSRARVLGRLSDREIIVLLLLLATLPYLNILGNGFTYDDNTQVLNNPYLRNFHHLGEIFTTTVWSYIGAQGLTNYYRPMMLFGYLLSYQLFGPLAYPFHLVSLLFHALVVLLVFRVAVEMLRNRVAAFVAAGLFALHPVHTESVAWVAAVTDVELTFFYLLTFWFFLRVAQPGGRRSALAQLAMAGGFVLTLMSKEQALTLPALATAYEHCYRDDRAETTWAQKLGRYYLLWMLAGAYLLFRVRFFGALAPVLQISDLTWKQTLLSATALVGQYCGKLLWPVELCAFYVFKRNTSVLEPRVLAGILALAVLGALFVVLWRRARPASFAILWMVVTLGPVLNPRWMAANVFTERYLYLPSAGFCWLLGMAWAYLWQRTQERGAPWRRVLVGLLVLLGALFILRVVTRNRDWNNDVTLYTKTLAVSPNSYHIRNNLGTVYWRHGDIAAAEGEWQEALRLAPRNAIIMNNLGLLRSKQERYGEAVEYFQRAMHLKPLYTDPHLNLGVAYTEMGQLQDAELQLRAAVALSPLRADARNKLGKLYSDAGRLDEAEKQFLKSVESEPNITGYDGLGAIYLRWGDGVRAARAFGRAVAIDAYDSVAHFQLGKLYRQAGRREDALREYQAGLATDPSNAEARAAIEEINSKGSRADSPPH